jgi:anti-sigma regulatory factor (Ser/Thr protein kinase)
MQAHASTPANTFRHEALLYSTPEEFLQGTVQFIREGLSGGEAVLVVEPADKIRLIREGLGSEGDGVHFADMSLVGANPALIIPAWRDFVEGNRLEGRGMRGIGEPIFEGRRPAELVECQRHEALLNVAFDNGVPWSLLCPYDTSVFGPAVLNEARRSHPLVREGPALLANGDRGIGSWAAPYDAPLPEPPAVNSRVSLTLDGLGAARSLVGDEARRAGLPAPRVADLVMAVNEVATNALRHGAGVAALSVWTGDGALVCQVQDGGHYDLPLGDRVRPGSDAGASRGLWLANHLCDLVQIRSDRSGTTVRLHVWLSALGQRPT